MPTLNLNQASKLYYGNVEAQKLYKGSELLYPIQALVDPYLANVVLHLKGGGANNSTDIIDSSPTAKTINRVGSPIISTAQSKYGGSSILFNGSSHIWGSMNNITGDFTVEMWVYWVTNPATGEKGIFQLSSTSGGLQPSYSHSTIGCNQSTGRYCFARANTLVTVATGSPSVGQWQHISHCRQGNNYYYSINGTVYSLGSSATAISSTHFVVGGYYSTSFRGNAYVDNLRITTGVARYTSNFNPEKDTYLAY